MGGYEIDGPWGPPSLLERYLFAAAAVDVPRVCCLATASGDSPVMLARFYEICEVLPCEPRHLALFQDRDVDDIDEFLFDIDVVYVLGGNTASMLGVWRVHGVDHALARRAAERELVVGGASAGGMCWFTAGFTMSFGPLTPLNDGLGWFNFVYKNDPDATVYHGVMAHEVKELRPQAYIPNYRGSGFDGVNYAALRT